MNRITTITKETANAEQKALLDAIQAQLGMVPNFLKIIANSPAALRAFLGLYGVAHEGSLDPKTRERIALAVAQQNSCEYCVSAHTAIGRKAGLDGRLSGRISSGSFTTPRPISQAQTRLAMLRLNQGLSGRSSQSAKTIRGSWRPCSSRAGVPSGNTALAAFLSLSTVGSK